MPKRTRETELPRPTAAPLDWKTIAGSGKVWDFIEGEDFNGKVASFRARLKTAARKSGVDFDSVEVRRHGTRILKVKAFLPEESPPHAEKRKPETGGAQLDFASLDTSGELAA